MTRYRYLPLGQNKVEDSSSVYNAVENDIIDVDRHQSEPVYQRTLRAQTMLKRQGTPAAMETFDEIKDKDDALTQDVSWPPLGLDVMLT